MESCETCKYQNKAEHEEPCKNCSHNETDNYEPMTNADRIRSMTDEELAEFIRTTIAETGDNLFLCEKYETTEYCIGYSCNATCKAYLKWLQSEVK